MPLQCGKKHAHTAAARVEDEVQHEILTEFFRTKEWTAEAEAFRESGVLLGFGAFRVSGVQGYV